MLAHSGPKCWHIQLVARAG